MKSFDSKACDVIRAKLEAALAEVKAELGVDISLGNMRYSDSEIRTSLTVVAAGVDKGKEDFEFYAPKFALRPEWYGKKFSQGGEEFTICGIKPRSRKYPVLARDAKGTVYKFAAPSVIAKLSSLKEVRV